MEDNAFAEAGQHKFYSVMHILVANDSRRDAGCFYKSSFKVSALERLLSAANEWNTL